MILVAFLHTTKPPLGGLVFTTQSTEASWEYIQFPRASLRLNLVRELAFS